MKTLKTWSVLIIVVIVITACGQAVATQDVPDLAEMQVAVQQTLDFENAIKAQLTDMAATSQPPTETASPPTAEPTQGPQPTSSVPMINVSMDTNCREGPDAKIWRAIGALLVGQKAEIVGKYEKGHWYIIKNPNNANERCWVFDFYATVEGDTSLLPRLTIPYTPTPEL